MFTAMNDRALRGDDACSHCATSSLPVPCSPVISTFASDGPMRSMSCRIGFIFGDSAIICGRWSRRSRRFSDSSRCARRSARPSSTCVVEDRDEPCVVPRLLDVVARAATHGFDGVVDAAPRRHDDHRHVRLERLQRRRGRDLLFPTSCRACSSCRAASRRSRAARARRARRLGELTVSTSKPFPLSSRRSASSTSA